MMFHVAKSHKIETAVILVNGNGCQHLAGTTPLMIAAEHGEKDIAQALLDAGADIEAKNNEGFKAEFFAWSKQHEDVLQLLKQ